MSTLQTLNQSTRRPRRLHRISKAVRNGGESLQRLSRRDRMRFWLRRHLRLRLRRPESRNERMSSTNTGNTSSILDLHPGTHLTLNPSPISGSGTRPSCTTSQILLLCCIFPNYDVLLAQAFLLLLYASLLFHLRLWGMLPAGFVCYGVSEKNGRALIFAKWKSI